MTKSASTTFTKPETAKDEFHTAFTGRFEGILRWNQLDELWEHVNASVDKEGKGGKSWYIYAVGEAPPEKTVNADELKKFITEIDVLLRREHDEDYCGIVYTDSTQAPNYIKIFDPNNIGTSCSTAKTPPLPGWILSTIKPIDLPNALSPPNNRKRWWNKLFNLKNE